MCIVFPPFLGLYKRNKSIGLYKSLGTQMLIAALFIVAEKWKQTKCASANRETNKMCYVPKMEHYSIIKCATT